jgi:hypothetical protein
MKLIIRHKGGSGSGFHGHAGRPGEQGGSLPGAGSGGKPDFHDTGNMAHQSQLGQPLPDKPSWLLAEDRKRFYRRQPVVSTGDLKGFKKTVIDGFPSYSKKINYGGKTSVLEVYQSDKDTWTVKIGRGSLVFESFDTLNDAVDWAKTRPFWK